MHHSQLRRRFEDLGLEGLDFRLKEPATREAISAAETRLGVVFSEQMQMLYSVFDGLEVCDPPFSICSIQNLSIENSSLTFCICDHIHRLAFDTSRVNDAGQWFIVNPDTGFRVTYTLASFWSVHMWKWIERRTPIWRGIHDEPAST